MKLPGPLHRGRLVRRYKRFLADVVLDDATPLTVHCPNSGSMTGMCEPGQEVVVSDSRNEKRKLRFTLERVRAGRSWVGVNTMVPNPVVREAVERGRIAELSGYEGVRPEVVSSDGSRIDLLLTAPDRPRCWVEVKNTTLRDGRVARFPDAVTERGRKHLLELERLRAEGHRAVMFFLVNRGDCDAMGPAQDVDPEYARELRRVASAGVELLAYRAVLGRDSVVVGRRLPVIL